MGGPEDVRFVWLDLEMTGLDPETCAIVELAIIVTGADLEPVAELARTVWQPEEVLARTTPFVRDMHTANGLYDRVRASKAGVADVERDAIELLARHTAFRSGILAGNSIHQDRRFLARHMPALEGFLHYRQVDVSSLKVLVGAWAKELAYEKKKGSHQALDDVRESIAEARHYRAMLFSAATGPGGSGRDT